MISQKRWPVTQRDELSIFLNFAASLFLAYSVSSDHQLLRGAA